VEHWTNPDLQEAFEGARKLLKRYGCPDDEVLVFHGTAERNIDSIMRGGFRVGGSGGHAIANGTALGYGVYSAFDPATAEGYGTLILCRALPGKPGTTCPRAAVDLPREAQHYAHGKIRVFFHASQLLPIFVLRF
jgi:hypothetical protein